MALCCTGDEPNALKFGMWATFHYIHHLSARQLNLKIWLTLGIKVVKVGIFFLLHLLGAFLLQLTKLYLRSKPPALQTLLDKTHEIMLTIFQSVTIVRLPLMIIIHLEIDFGDPQSKIYGLVLQMLYDCALVAILAVTITNMVLIYAPRLLEQAEEGTFVIIVSTIIGLVSATSVLLSWQMDWCILAHKMLRQLGTPCTSIGPLRRCLSATCLLLTVGFKLSLIWTKNAIAEGEREHLQWKSHAFDRSTCCHHLSSPTRIRSSNNYHGWKSKRNHAIGTHHGRVSQWQLGKVCWCLPWKMDSWMG